MLSLFTAKPFSLPLSTFTRLFSVDETPFYVSDNAFKKLSQMTADNDKFLRVKVEEGGCAGLKYSFDLDSEKSEDDKVVKQDSGPEVHVDPFSLAFLQDAMLDFIQEDFREYFKIVNPHATATCSCGESYSV
ncbi:heme biosynthesis protein HemY [Carpediemonas membranifera]|uniref:Heme biosynthesis protein HemY n=1 Tax=Carpediemonas membranifera TaxID=201153 RepID=A0A8J6E3J7_9EUKA|nr:heme biosynthesis protein HemY [Carpediemonas membranifera]|eukprot:KAG9393277.1 heme biosynthesis protein HemY [Carpediemonas membranifera]